VAWPTQVWLALLVALVIVGAFVLRRMSQLVTRTRTLERFQRDAASLDARFGAVADPLVSQLDEIRRRAGDPRTAVNALPGAAEVLRAAAVDARALRPPHALGELAAGLVRELDRAVRAAEMVEHGLDALLAVRGSRELEAQTSLKRGALNLRHARGTFHEIAIAILRVRPADLAVQVQPRAGMPAHSVPTYLVDGFDDGPGSSADPRM
jgi:hypothetical protein